MVRKPRQGGIWHDSTFKVSKAWAEKRVKYVESFLLTEMSWQLENCRLGYCCAKNVELLWIFSRSWKSGTEDWRWIKHLSLIHFLFFPQDEYFFELDDKAVLPGYPKLIEDVWGIPGPIDAAFTRINCNGQSYIFKVQSLIYIKHYKSFSPSDNLYVCARKMLKQVSGVVSWWSDDVYMFSTL